MHKTNRYRPGAVNLKDPAIFRHIRAVVLQHVTNVSKNAFSLRPRLVTHIAVGKVAHGGVADAPVGFSKTTETPEAIRARPCAVLVTRRGGVERFGSQRG